MHNSKPDKQKCNPKNVILMCVIIIFLLVITVVVLSVIVFIMHTKSIYSQDLPFSAIGYRLPDDLQPELYQLTIKFNQLSKIPAKHHFNGSVAINLKCVERTNRIVLNYKALNVDTEQISVVELDTLGESINPKSIVVSKVTLDPDRQMIQIDLKTKNNNVFWLQKDSIYQVKFSKFSGPLKLKGYISAFTGLHKDNEYYVVTQMQTHFARMLFPCFDEPGIKSKFQVNIIRHKAWKALSNMELESSKTVASDPNWQLDKFKTTPGPMSTYLIAMTVSKWKYNTFDYSGRIKIRVWSRPDALKQQSIAIKAIKRILPAYERVFQDKCTLKKIDLICFAGYPYKGMENWGLIVFRENQLLDFFNGQSALRIYEIARVISHEIVHMWTGNSVTEKWWDDSWLAEGITVYLEQVGIDGFDKNWRYREWFAGNMMLPIMQTDSYADVQPIKFDIEKPNDILKIFTYLLYQKGSSIIRMLEPLVGGQQVVENGLRQFVKTYALSSISSKDFFKTFDSLAKDNKIDIGVFNSIENFMLPWLTQPGYPIITIELKDDGMSLSGYQERFLFGCNSVKEKKKYWPIALTYVTSDTISTEKLSKPDMLKFQTRIFSYKFPKKITWILTNIEAKGYFRVKYSSNILNELVKALKNSPKDFPAASKYGLIDDYYNIALRNYGADFVEFINIIEYLENEDDVLCWLHSSDVLQKFDQTVTQHVTAKDIKKIRLYKMLAKLFTKIFPKMDFTTLNEQDNHINNLARPKVLWMACLVGNELCTDWMDKSLKKPGKTLQDYPASLQSIIYCFNVQNGKITDWKTNSEKYLIGVSCVSQDSEFDNIVEKMKIEEITQLLGLRLINPPHRYKKTFKRALELIKSNQIQTNIKNLMMIITKNCINHGICPNYYQILCMQKQNKKKAINLSPSLFTNALTMRHIQFFSVKRNKEIRDLMN